MPSGAQQALPQRKRRTVYFLHHNVTWQGLLISVGVLAAAALVGFAQGLFDNYREKHPKH